MAGLKVRVNGAIAARDEPVGSAAHNDLLSAEWRQRQAERRDRGRGVEPGPGTVSFDGSTTALRPCRWCFSERGRLQAPKGPHGEGVRCACCDRHLTWLPKKAPEESPIDQPGGEP